jgi:hypothetical protein
VAAIVMAFIVSTRCQNLSGAHQANTIVTYAIHRIFSSPLKLERHLDFGAD